jgi:DNA-binding PadR family transcriptional regulator
VRPSTIAYSLKQLKKQGLVSYMEDYRHRSGLFDVTARGMRG